MIGTRFGNRYEVLESLGMGGFGQVYRARDHELGRDVALKVLREGSEDLRREAAILARFNHHGIVTVHDFGEHDGGFYLVMELVSGVPLAQIVGEGTIEATRAVLVGARVARAMAYAHDEGVVHRDLSLDNIMVLEGGDGSEIKIIDFGLGKSDADADADGIAEGSLRYMAPEQISGGKADTRTDIYAMGICLYRLLGGRFPFDENHFGAFEYSIQYDSPPPLSREVPGDLESLVMKCLAKDPDQRPANFLAIATALEGADLGSAAASAPPVRRNPYLNRVMIQNPEDFYGRKREVRKIFSRLDAPQPQCISVVGDRRIGKSSLLNHVFNEGVRRKHMTQADKSVFVFMDFQSNHCKDSTGFIRLLLSGLPAECRGGQSANDSPSFTDLEVAAANLDSQGRRLLVLMDEFERITNNDAFEQVFFSNLRSLANLYNVAYVTSSYAELQDLCHTREISDSPFFNIFSNLPLGPFRPETAAELVRDPSERQGTPLERHTDRLVALAGLRPMNLQIACSCLFDAVQGDAADEVDWDEVIRNFREEILPHYEFVWKRLSDSERETLTRLASGKAVARQQEHLCGDLRKRGLITSEGSGTRIESEAFRDFILEQGPPRSEGWLGRLMGRGR